MNSKKLGDRIRDLRESRNIMQKDLAEFFGVEKSTWSQYENNKRIPDIEMLKRICEYFQISADYLLSITDKKYNPYSFEFLELVDRFNSLAEQSKAEVFKNSKNNDK